MKIKKIEIENFRNIDNFEYEISQPTTKTIIFSGLNHIGKTNTLDAIYWCLTDSLLEEGSNIASIKPLNNSKAVVRVKLTLWDGQTIEKTYREKWTKTRGSDVETLTGHEETIVINGIKQKTLSVGLEQIKKMFFGKLPDFPKAIDPFRALTNPTYLSEQCNWKDFRELIISIVGDVTEEDVFNTNPEHFKPLKEYSYCDTYSLNKYFVSQIKTLKDSITNRKYLIKNLQETKNPTDEELDHAKSYIKSYNLALDEFTRGQTSNYLESKQAELDKAEEEFKQAKRDKAFLENKIEKKMMIVKNDIYQKLINISNNLNQLEKTSPEGIANKLNDHIKDNEEKIEDCNNTIKNYGSLYRSLKNQLESIQVIKCPNCGHVLNQDDIDARVDKIKANMREAVKMGQEVATIKEKLQLEIEEMQTNLKNLQPKIDEHNEKINELTALENKYKDELKAIKLSKEDEFSIQEASDDVATKRDIVTNLKKVIDELITQQTQDKKVLQAAFIAKHKAEFDEAQKIVNQRTIYLNDQQRITSEQKNIEVEGQKITQYEQCQVLLSELLKKKLEMLNHNIELKFPNLSCVLATENIKEGSWNQTCYFNIVGKNNPYAQGSSSEKLVTGAWIIANIITNLGFDPIPMFIDEGEKLDDYTLRHFPSTNQLFCTIVEAQAVPGQIKIQEMFGSIVPEEE